jgi:hypothetical protein
MLAVLVVVVVAAVGCSSCHAVKLTGQLPRRRHGLPAVHVIRRLLHRVLLLIALVIIAAIVAAVAVAVAVRVHPQLLPALHGKVARLRRLPHIVRRLLRSEPAGIVRKVVMVIVIVIK